MSFPEIDAMTMDDYADMEAYWAVNPPIGRTVAAYFKIKPGRVRRRSQSGPPTAAGVSAADLSKSLGL